MYHCNNKSFCGDLMQQDSTEEVTKISDSDLVNYINNGEYAYLQPLINRYMPYVISVASR